MNQSRLYYIDNLRIFLICLVVLLHLNITYGAPGDWYYNESKAGFPEILPMAMFNATNQSFFMGMFFMISAFFIIPSLQRKGSGKFITDRLIRLGIPLLVFYFILNPLTVFIRNWFIRGEDPTFGEYLVNGSARGFGPLWFVEALLIFTFIFLLFRKTISSIQISFPGTFKIILFALVTAILQFIIRIWLPVGWSMPFTNFQFPFFVQYIFLFPLGIIACQNKWFDSISFKTGKQWFLAAQILIFIGFPMLFILGGATETGTDNFMGGVKWQSLGYAVWEQLTGISLIIGLIGLGKKYLNRQGTLAKLLSDSAYGVFVFHAPIIVGISALFVSWAIFPPLKFIVLAPVALAACFIFAGLLKKIPGINKVL
jgi:surface polysaccharide O-acyltransferase-like enzyme